MGTAPLTAAERGVLFNAIAAGLYGQTWGDAPAGSASTPADEDLVLAATRDSGVRTTALHPEGTGDTGARGA